MTSALDGMSGQRHALAALYPGERAPGIGWTGVWVGLRAVLDTEASESNLDRQIVQSVVRHYTD
jgi:hypothetical protein